ncbi:Neuropeptide-Like Protein [Caenorhabditis elegans]|uniref:Neuropeptide-Like Protein n=1 Tax=Caenorhabditis elegans TaxID=6239 RepID=Q9NA97_CAEEL|nr:Neuropeptide-Like Protein [Caenorhabditis elegans]CAB70111.3 Neuropeptide-Like Protein [Caenorhabditis elegans]|eukprot:NP_497109.3 Uncharacterized protein CELE_Y53F4B.23 [Caenorhabditis elegans]
MKISLIFIAFIAICSSTTVYKVRKVIRRAEARHSAADDDLDMAAAELVFKEQSSLNSGADRIEGPPRKLPFGTEHAAEKASEHTGAPSAEPTFSDLQKTQLEDIKNDENALALKSSMVGKGTEESDAPFAHGVNDGETSKVLAWQRPLASHGRQVAYDFHVNPEYPQFAPRAHGLVGIPDGWNLDRTIDEEFKSGFRNVNFRRRRH